MRRAANRRRPNAWLRFEIKNDKRALRFTYHLQRDKLRAVLSREERYLLPLSDLGYHPYPLELIDRIMGPEVVICTMFSFSWLSTTKLISRSKRHWRIIA